MARIVSQAIDELGNFYLLKDDGILEKRTSLNVLTWSQQTRQEPSTGVFVYANQISLDLDNNVWLSCSDTLNTSVRSTVTGLQIAEVLGTPANVLVSQAGGSKMFALSTSRGLLHEVNRTTKALIRTLDLNVKIPLFKKTFVTQMASSLAGHIYFGALVGEVGAPGAGQLVKFDPTGDGTFACYALPGVDMILQATSADVAGNVYVSSLHGSLFRFSESLSVFQAMHQPVGAGGVVNIITFTNTNQPVLVDDGTYSFLGSKTRIINPANGDQVSVTTSSDVGTVQGDPLGYHHIKMTRLNVPPAPIVPVVNVNLIEVFVKPDGTITFTGRPGALTDTVSVEGIIVAGPVSVGTVTPNTDGSFSITSAPGVGFIGGEAVQVKAVNGLQIVTVSENSVPRSLPVAFDVAFQTSGFVLMGQSTRLKAKLFDTPGGPVTTPAPGTLPIFRLKRDSDGKWFNGQSFVADNGDYLQPAFDVDGQFWFIDVTLPLGAAGQLTLLIKDSPPYSTHLIMLPEIAHQGDLLEVKAIVEELNSQVDIAFGAPAGSFTDPATIGGFIFEKLNDIQKTVRIVKAGIIGQKNVQMESILTDVDRQSAAKGSTPAIDITIYDADRRFPIDISGAQVYFRAKVNLASEILVIDRLCEIVDGPTGQARAKLTAQDTATAQRLSAQIVCVIPGTGTLVSPAFIFDILESVL